MKNLRYLIIMLAVIVCGNLYAQKSQQELNQLMQQRNEYYFTFMLNGNDDLNAIARTISVDRVDGKTVTAYANNNDFVNFQKLGYEVTLQTPPSLMEQVAMWDGSNRAAYDWDSYPTYTAYEDMMFQFATDHPDRCEIITLGTLPSGRKIMVAHLNNGSGAGKPKFLYSSTIHGDETTGWIMMLRLIDYLLENPDEPEVQTVMDNIDLYIAPNTNPDGTYHGGNNSVNGATRSNANGIDMNRNYADPHGSAHPDGNDYQTETQWFMQFADEIPFVMGANYHGGAEVMNYPWDNTYTFHADDAWYQMISHEYADLTHQESPNYMTEYNNGITNGAQWYMIGGGRQDYMNGYAQCRELTIECSDTKLPNGNQLPNFWNYNKNSIFAFMNQCIYGIHGVVTDSITGEPLEATITISGHDDEYSIVESHLPAGDFHRPIKGGNWYVIISKDGYCPKIVDVNVADHETVNLNVQLVPGSCMVADFYASETQVSLGQSISFSDNSFGEIVSWNWEFEGATPSTSTQQNPQNITYNETGDYSVSLTITDGDGNSETLTRNNYIHVRESYNMQDGTVTTCNAMFYDNGGPNNNYNNNRNYTLTFLPATSGSMLEAVFEEFTLENNYDFLYIYDGTSTNAPQIGQYSGNNSPGTVTATNSEGALTFRFTSDYYTTDLGWRAAIHCVGSYNPIALEVSAEPMVIVLGESSQLSVIATGGSGSYTYLWEPANPQNEGTLSNPAIANPIVTPVLAPESIYKITVTDTEGNMASDDITIEVKPMSVAEDGGQTFIYPNPSSGNFTIRANGEVSFQLYNSLGQLVQSGNFTDETQIQADGLSKGIYLLHLSNQAGSKMEKLIIEK